MPHMKSLWPQSERDLNVGTRGDCGKPQGVVKQQVFPQNQYVARQLVKDCPVLTSDSPIFR